MKITSVVLLILGLVLCPAYLIYTTAFSGEEVGTLAFIDQDITAFSVGGFSSRSTGEDRSKKVNNIQLTPEMNPIRLISKAKYIPSRSISMTEYSKYELSLFDGNSKLWTEAFNVSESSNNDDSSSNSVVNSSQSVKLFTVDKTAEYQMKLKRLREQDVSVSSLSIEVRRNVMTVDSKIWGTGVILILLSIVGFFVSNKKRN